MRFLFSLDMRVPVSHTITPPITTQAGQGHAMAAETPKTLDTILSGLTELSEKNKTAIQKYISQNNITDLTNYLAKYVDSGSITETDKTEILNAAFPQAAVSAQPAAPSKQISDGEISRKLQDTGINNINVNTLPVPARDNLRAIVSDTELLKEFAALSDADRKDSLQSLNVPRSAEEIKTGLQGSGQSGNVSSSPSKHDDVLNILYHPNGDVEISAELKNVQLTQYEEQKALFRELYAIAHRTPLNKELLIQKLETVAQKFLWSPQMIADFKGQLEKMPAADIAAIFNNNNNFENSTVFNNTFNQLFDIAAISIEEHSDDTAYISTRLQWFSSPPENLLNASLDEIALLCSKLPNLRNDSIKLEDFLEALSNLSHNVLDGYYSGKNPDLIKDFAAFLRDPESIITLAETLSTGTFGADIGPAAVESQMYNLFNQQPPLQANRIRDILNNISDGNGGRTKYVLLKDGMIEQCLDNPGNTDHVFGRTKTPPDASRPAPDTEFVRTLTGYEKEYDSLVKSGTIKLTGEQARYQQESSNRVADNREQAADYYDQHSDEYPGLGDALRSAAAAARDLSNTIGQILKNSPAAPYGQATPENATGSVSENTSDTIYMGGKTSDTLSTAINSLLKAANAEEAKAELANVRAELHKLDAEQIEKNVQANIEFNAGLAEKAEAVQAAAREIVRRLDTVNAGLAEIEKQRAETENSAVLDDTQKQKILAGLDMAEAALLAEKSETLLLLRETSDTLQNASVNASPANVFKAANQLTPDDPLFPDNLAARLNNYIASKAIAVSNGARINQWLFRISATGVLASYTSDLNIALEYYKTKMAALEIESFSAAMTEQRKEIESVSAAKTEQENQEARREAREVASSWCATLSEILRAELGLAAPDESSENSLKQKQLEQQQKELTRPNKLETMLWGLEKLTLDKQNILLEELLQSDPPLNGEELECLAELADDPRLKMTLNLQANLDNLSLQNLVVSLKGINIQELPDGLRDKIVGKFLQAINNISVENVTPEQARALQSISDNRSLPDNVRAAAIAKLAGIQSSEQSEQNESAVLQPAAA